ncbi:amino acid-binding protein [Mycolicibacterium brumae]|uniref:Amino acid-binding protein n=1 Tax=Mycolicibacterium brumae TaxID=85968 RepID=A0A2G5PBT6_9MYCO|nr:amino acid-binding protein [Mycolicibacterium brumae]
MPSYLLRVQLADRPGSLGSLAVALGSVGADILSLDVVERTPDFAIDDLVVDLPAGAMPDSVITAAEALNGIRVESIRPHTGLLEAHRELELINHVAAAPRADKLQVLVDEAPRVLRVAWASVIRRTTTKSGADGLERVVGSAGAPESTATHAPWLPLSEAVALDADADWVPQLLRDLDTALAAAPLGGPDTALVLGRGGGPDFRAPEIARLGYLSGIVGSLLR